MRQYFKQFFSLLTILCCLVGVILPVQASSTEEPAPTTVHVTFENEKDDTIALYVTKHVQAVGEYTIPDDLSFSFILKLDGKPAKSVAYTVTGADGSVISDKNGEPVYYQTGRDGTFTLKPEQTAGFVDVREGMRYEVRELTKEGWTQILPSNGDPASGMINGTKPEANIAAFTNETGGAGNAQLLVQKLVSFPEGYELPGAEEFTFQVKLKGVPYAWENYMVEDSGGKVKIGTTDGEGCFTIRGGQTAVFDGIPVNADYEVQEMLSQEQEAAGWRATGDTGKSGSTSDSGPTKLTFSNALGSFGVTKKMEDGSTPEEDFTFQLTHGDRSVWAGAKYYLYDADKTLVTDASGVAEIGETDKSGCFSLKPGQTVIFYGIAGGEVYNVSEVGRPDYVQVFPVSSAGYTDYTVTSDVKLLEFVNTPSDGGLSVTKLVEAVNEDLPLEEKVFTFVLSRKAEAPSEEYVPVADAAYSIKIGSSQYTYQTDAQGQFALKANETAQFADLPAGDYRVEELEDSSGMEYTAQEPVQEQTLATGGEPPAFIFHNQYASRFFDLYLKKANRGGDALPGAEFMLYRDALGNNPVSENAYISDGEGKITIQGLKTGTYYLVETKSPKGYQLLANPVQIQVTWEGAVMHVTVDEKEVTSEETDKQIYIVKGTAKDEHDQVHITVYNSRSFSLPLTGGAGGLAVMAAGIAGILFIIIAGLRRLKAQKS